MASHRRHWLLSLAAAIAVFPSIVKSDWGGYVDPTFNCPAMTTCQQVCVAQEINCPFQMLCNGTQTLCPDGSCAEVCDPNAVSPCEFQCAPVACHPVVDFFDACEAKYGFLYDEEKRCGAIETAAQQHLYTFREKGFLFVYAWIILSTGILWFWCFYNQKVNPVSGSTQVLQLDSTSKGSPIKAEDVSQGFQTGYRIHPVGRWIHVLTNITLWGFQFLLAFLTIQYYNQQGAIGGTKGHELIGHFDSEKQVLLAFEITWSKFLV